MPNGIPDPRLRGRPQPPPSGPTVSPGPMIFLILIYLIYIGGAIVAPLFVAEVAEQVDPQFPPLYRFIGAIVLFVIFAVIGALIYRPRQAPQQPPRPPQPTPRPPSPQPAAVKKPVQQVNKFKPVSQGAKPAVNKPEPARSKEPKVFTYPAVVEGGIFGDTYIEVTDQKIIRIRSLVVEPGYMK